MSPKGGAIFLLIISCVLFTFSNHHFSIKHSFGYIKVHKPIKLVMTPKPTTLKFSVLFNLFLEKSLLTCGHKNNHQKLTTLKTFKI